MGFGGRNDSLCVVDKLWPRILCHSLKKEVDSISLTLKFGQSYDLLWPVDCGRDILQFQNLCFKKPCNFCLFLPGPLGWHCMERSQSNSIVGNTTFLMFHKALSLRIVLCTILDSYVTCLCFWILVNISFNPVHHRVTQLRSTNVLLSLRHRPVVRFKCGNKLALPLPFKGTHLSAMDKVIRSKRLQQKLRICSVERTSEKERTKGPTCEVICLKS